MPNSVEHLKGFKSRFPVDVFGLARALGISVRAEDLGEQQSGYLRKELDGTYAVGLNPYDSDQRRRFTLAHELGHYFLHRDLLVAGENHFDRLYGGHNDSGVLKPKHEAQANRFAAETLMPEAEIRHDYFMHSGSNVEFSGRMANKFDVSTVAMSWRLVNLRIASRDDLGL